MNSFPALSRKKPDEILRRGELGWAWLGLARPAALLRCVSRPVRSVIAEPEGALDVVGLGDKQERQT